IMDCLYAKCIPCITDCVMAEIDKLRQKTSKDPRFEQLPYNCLVQRVTQHKCYIVATVDWDFKRRIPKIFGVPIVDISIHRYNIEQMPDDYGDPQL
uniref:PIN domain-containing protein n=1 Tax=Aotus nancymaae TaxID=37293 RepID=A0A2K5DSU2_AOTNA